jgi:predicted DCC family thiol-disulfide oxidoreductase YuxK
MEEVPVVLIYDADCPVCRAAADWVRRNALVPDTFEYLPCRSAETRSRFPAISEAACLRAMHLVLPGGAILSGEQALPEIVRRTRRYRRAAALFRLPGAGILSRLFYGAFARRRHRIARLFPPG